MATIPKRPIRKNALPDAPVRSRKDQLTNTMAFMRLLWAVDHGLRSLSKQMQARIGLTGPQRLVLRIVGRFPAMMPSELAELLHLDRGTLSGILERLVAQQLLVREPHHQDKRSVLVSLTGRGRLLDRETAGTVEACVRRALASVPRDQVDAAKLVLEAVARELLSEQNREPDGDA
jgi:MarR family transcriptional regulator, organic hydroperoxide resistance regulator